MAIDVMRAKHGNGESNICAAIKDYQLAIMRKRTAATAFDRGAEFKIEANPIRRGMGCTFDYETQRTSRYVCLNKLEVIRVLNN